MRGVPILIAVFFVCGVAEAQPPEEPAPEQPPDAEAPETETEPETESEAEPETEPQPETEPEVPVPMEPPPEPAPAAISEPAPALPAPAPSAPAWAAEAPPPREAGPQRMPTPLAERPLSLPTGVLRIDVPFQVTNTSIGTASGDSQTFVTLAGGLAGGATDDVELGATLLPIQLAPRSNFLDPTIYLLYRFTDGAVQTGLETRLRIDLDQAWGVQGAFRLRIQASEKLRIDASAGGGANFIEPQTAGFFSVPVGLVFNPSPRFFLGVQSGMDFAFGFVDPATSEVRDDAYVVAGGFLGFSIEREVGPSADIRFGFFFPNVQEIDNLWQLGFAVTIYAFL